MMYYLQHKAAHAYSNSNAQSITYDTPAACGGPEQSPDEGYGADLESGNSLLHCHHRFRQRANSGVELPSFSHDNLPPRQK